MDALNKVFVATKISKFHLYNGPKTYSVETHPFYQLWRVMYFSYYYSESCDLTLDIFKIFIKWLKEHRDNAALNTA